jgi:hypothetical protein
MLGIPSTQHSNQYSPCILSTQCIPAQDCCGLDLIMHIPARTRLHLWSKVFLCNSDVSDWFEDDEGTVVHLQWVFHCGQSCPYCMHPMPLCIIPAEHSAFGSLPTGLPQNIKYPSSSDQKMFLLEPGRHESYGRDPKVFRFGRKGIFTKTNMYTIR